MSEVGGIKRGGIMSKAIPLNPQAVKKGDEVFLIPFHNHSFEEKALYPHFLEDEYKEKQGLTGAELDYKDYRKIIFTIDSVIEVANTKTKKKDFFLLFKDFPEAEGVRLMFRAQYFSTLSNH